MSVYIRTLTRQIDDERASRLASDWARPQPSQTFRQKIEQRCLQSESAPSNFTPWPWNGKLMPGSKPAHIEIFRGTASLGFNVHYHAQLHCHKQLSYLLKSSHKIENYNMRELSAKLFGFVVIFNLDKNSPSLWIWKRLKNLNCKKKEKKGK